MMGLHRDEAVAGQKRGVKEDREGQEYQQSRDRWELRVSRLCAVRTHFARAV